MKPETRLQRSKAGSRLKKSMIPLLCGALLAGCTSPSSGSSQKTSSESKTPSISNSSSATSADPTSVKMEQDGYNVFSWNLFTKTSKDHENTQISPLSAYYALGMCVNGASGETRRQMEEMLGLSTEQINAQASRLLQRLEDDPNRQLQLADSLWVNTNSSTEIRKDYQENMKNLYDAEVFAQAFSDQTVGDINAWVSEKTDGQIPEMLQRLDPSTVLVLLNALNFHADWQEVYQPENVSKGEFHDAAGAVSEMDFMHSNESLYVEAEGLRGFIKPYTDGRYGLAALIPADENASLDEILQKADGMKLMEALASPQVVSVQTSLPSFEDTASIPLNEVLQSMGMVDAFDDQADFSGLAERSQGLMISEVLQKTRIKVDPKGTEAAAATEIGIVETAAIAEEAAPVICDRPFLYILMDMDSGSPLMMGTFQMPGAVEES